MGGGDAIDDLAGGVGGAVVDDEDFEVGVVQGEDGVQCGFDVRGFVARGNDDGDAGNFPIRMR